MHSLAAVAVLMAAMGGTPDGVVLNFTASWCGPCQQMAPTVSRLQQQGYAIRKVDFDRERQLAKQLQVDGVPTFILVVRGEERGRFSGVMSESELRRMAGSIPEKAATATLVAETKAPLGNRVGLSKQLESPSAGSSFIPTSKAPKSQSVIRANIGDPAENTFSSDPMQVSVRLRVTDSEGMDWGSGTVISSEPSQTLILTCGHIFRHFDHKSRIEVDVFDGPKYQRLEGSVVKFDLKKDIGLVSVRTPQILPVSRIAAEPIRDGEHVFSVGCGGGEAPSKLQHRVTKTTGYLEDIVECTGVPVSGRSGGGLFSTNGEVVAVCILADPNGRRGLYMGLKTIHGLLEQCGLRRLGGSAGTSLASAANESSEKAPPLPDLPQFSDAPASGFKDAGTQEDHLAPLSLESVASGRDVKNDLERNARPTARTSVLSSSTVDFEKEASAAMRKSSQTTGSALVAGPSVESLRGTLDAAKGAEVVCIIRDPNRPDSASRVVIIHRASDRFVADLTGELEHQVQRTSLADRGPTTSQPVSASVAQVTPGPQPYRRRR